MVTIRRTLTYPPHIVNWKPDVRPPLPNDLIFRIIRESTVMKRTAAAKAQMDLVVADLNKIAKYVKEEEGEPDRDSFVLRLRELRGDEMPDPFMDRFFSVAVYWGYGADWAPRTKGDEEQFDRSGEDMVEAFWGDPRLGCISAKWRWGELGPYELNQNKSESWIYSSY